MFVVAVRDGCVHGLSGHVQKLSKLFLGCRAPRVIGSMRQLVNAIHNRVGRERQAELRSDWMMNDREAGLKSEFLSREMFADMSGRSAVIH